MLNKGLFISRDFNGDIYIIVLCLKALKVFFCETPINSCSSHLEMLLLGPLVTILADSFCSAHSNFQQQIQDVAFI